MKDTYLKKILGNDDVLLRTMFSLVWDNRQVHGDPEENHPDWEQVKNSFTRLCTDENYFILWDVLKCFAETYYVIGLKQGLSSHKSILPCVNILANPFVDESTDE